MKCFLAVSGFIFLRNNAISQVVVKRGFQWLFSYQYRQCTRLRSLKATWLDWRYPWSLGIDILFSFCIKQWDKFKLDYSEQDYKNLPWCPLQKSRVVDSGKLNPYVAASLVVLSAWKNIRGLQELNKATCPVYERRPHVFVLQLILQLIRFVLQLNLTALLFISDMPWLHLRFRRLITAITNAKLHELHARFFSPVFWIGFDQCSTKAL